MTTNVDCPFCEIVNRQDPDAREVFRNDTVVAFFPTDPATLGHTLVIPRRHIADIWELDDAVAVQLGRAVLKLAAAIRVALQPDGLNVIQSNGEAATQTVDHLHVHVVPRWVGDPVGRIWPPETAYTTRQKDEALWALRDELRRELLRG